MRSGLGLVLVLVLGVGCKVSTRTEELSTSVDFSEVLVKSGPGDIAVLPSEDGDFHLVAKLYGKNANYDYEVKNDKLTVKRRCKFAHLKPCYADFTLYLPDDMALDLRAGAGSISVEGWVGDVDISTSSGNVLLVDQMGFASATAASGGITVDGASADTLSLTTDSGPVSVDIVDGFNLLDVETASGEVAVTVPSGDYDMSLQSDSGSIITDAVNQDSGSGQEIVVVTASGNVAVIGR